MLAQGVQLFLFAVEPGAENGRLPEDVHFRGAFLVPEVRNLPLELLEEVLQPDSPLSLHVVVQVAFLEGFLLFGGLGRAGDRLAGDSLLLVAVLMVAVLAAVVFAGPLARVRYTAAVGRQRGVRAGDAGRRRRGEIVGRVTVGFAGAVLTTAAGHAMVRRVIFARVTAPVVVRRVALRVLADLEGHPAFDVALVTGRRIRRQVLLTYRYDVDFFVLCKGWERESRKKEGYNQRFFFG